MNIRALKYGPVRFLAGATAIVAVAVIGVTASILPVQAAEPVLDPEVPDRDLYGSPDISSPLASIHEFRGGGYVKNFSSACTDAGWTGKHYMSVRYRPPNLGVNGPQTRFSFFFPLFYAENYILNSGNLNSSFKTVQGSGLSTEPFTFTNDPKMRVTKKSPSNVNGGTEHVNLTGRIKGWADIPGCHATFQISLTRKP